MECALCKSSVCRKSWTAFNIRRNNHRKDITNPKSITADLHVRKPGHSLNLHEKFTLMEQLSNVHTPNKATLKFHLKRLKDLRIKNFEVLTPKGLNQELNIEIPANCIFCLPFSILYFRLQLANATLLSYHLN